MRMNVTKYNILSLVACIALCFAALVYYQDTKFLYVFASILVLDSILLGVYFENYIQKELEND